MEIHKSIHGYPIFYMEKEIEYWEPDLWIDMIGKINPDYFQRGRFSYDKKVHQMSVIDCVSYYNEGDTWVFSLVDLEFADKTSNTVFLPLLQTILPEDKEGYHYAVKINKGLYDNPQWIAFSMQTESERFGKRNWVVYDAFYNDNISLILTNMFWPDQAYYSLVVHNGCFGEIVFNTKIGFEDDELTYRLKMTIDDRGYISIGNNKSMLYIPNDLRILDMDKVKKEKDLAGWIEYKSREKGNIGIGIIKRFGTGD